MIGNTYSHDVIVPCIAENTGWKQAAVVPNDEFDTTLVVYETPRDVISVVYRNDGGWITRAYHREKGCDPFYARDNFDPASNELLGLLSMWMYERGTK